MRRGKGFKNEKPRLGSPIDNTDCSTYFGIDKSFRFVEGNYKGSHSKSGLPFPTETHFSLICETFKEPHPPLRGCHAKDTQEGNLDMKTVNVARLNPKP